VKSAKIGQIQTAIAEKYISYRLAFWHGARYMSWSSESTFRLILPFHMAKCQQTGKFMFLVSFFKSF
jgi:hypothetical protein